MTEYHAAYASELYTAGGPTGTFREVLEAREEDAGGNLVRGPWKAAAFAFRSLRAGHVLRPTKLGEPCVSADYLCAPHYEDQR